MANNDSLANTSNSALYNLSAPQVKSPSPMGMSEEERHAWADRVVDRPTPPSLKSPIQLISKEDPKPVKQDKELKVKKPAFDKQAPGGIPPRAMGKFLHPELRSHLYEMSIKTLLIRSQLALSYNDNLQAESLATTAGSLAHTVLRNRLLLGKCSYWRGVAEFNCRRYEDAAASFREAHLSGIKGFYIEGEDAEQRFADSLKRAPATPKTAELRSSTEAKTPFRADSKRWHTPATANSNRAFFPTPRTGRFGFSYSKSPASAAANHGFSLEDELAAAGLGGATEDFELEDDHDGASKLNFPAGGETYEYPPPPQWWKDAPLDGASPVPQPQSLLKRKKARGMTQLPDLPEIDTAAKPNVRDRSKSAVARHGA